MDNDNMMSIKNATTEGNNENGKIIYDLYAVSNHYGTLNGGHYTAMCRNPVTETWYEFDDSSISKIGRNQ